MARAWPIIARSMRRWLVDLALFVLWLLGGPSAVQAAWTLDWRAPAACPDQAAARQRVESALGSSWSADVERVRARIEQVDDGYILDLRIDGADASHDKRLLARQCSTFVELIALELRLAAETRGAAEPPAVPANRQPRLGWGLRAGALVASDPTPAPAWGAQLALELHVERVLVTLGANFFAPRTLYYSEAPEVGASLYALTGETRGCYAFAFRRVALPLCLGAELGAIAGEGRGVAEAASERRLWAALFATPGVRVHVVGPWWLFAEVGPWFGLRRPSFGIRNLPTLYRPAVVSVRGSLGLALQFP
ncbi:MAG TPA: hypothetical protein VFZ61_09420 [Polyangiales bacterium]